MRQLILLLILLIQGLPNNIIRKCFCETVGIKVSKGKNTVLNTNNCKTMERKNFKSRRFIKIVTKNTNSSNTQGEAKS